MSRHNKTHSGQSSSLRTETSQSFVSGAPGSRPGGLDAALEHLVDHRAYASADRSASVEEVGEDEEDEQLALVMQMHDMHDMHDDLHAGGAGSGAD